MPTPPHLPPVLPARCFTTDEARAAGVTVGQLKGVAYDSVARNVWSLAARRRPEEPADRVSDILLALQQVLPRTAASHVTAGLLLGLRLPLRVRRAEPVHLTRWGPGDPPEMTGIAGHSGTLGAEDRWSRSGLRLTGPTRTVVDIAAMRGPGASWLLTDDELVAVLDGVVNEHLHGYSAGVPPMRDLARVRQDLQRMAKRRGVARVRAALLRARVGVDSALETRTRLLLEGHGLSGWSTDVELLAPGHRTVHPDLADLQRRIAVQVEGPHHDSDRQRVRDIERQRATEAAGWVEARIVSADLRSVRGGPPRAVHVVREARRRAEKAVP